MLCFEKISFGNFILLEHVCLMIFCYILECFMSLGDFEFYEIGLIFLMSILRTNKIHKHKF